jgi:predicted NAD/FAD-dependent oxidoreductase
MRLLQERGYITHGFDKGRGAGGRASTRRADTLRFDHGAQYFTVREPEFRAVVDAWLAAGIVAPWTGSIWLLRPGERPRLTEPRDRYVGVPGMSAIARHLADGLDVRFGARIARIERQGNRWSLFADSAESLGEYDGVIVTTPPEQASQLLEPLPRLSEVAESVSSDPCWAVMASFADPIPVEAGFAGAFVEESPLSWVARDSSKPGRPSGECWVLHGSPGWSRDHVESDPSVVEETLLSALFKALGCPAREPVHRAAHRWRYARALDPLESACLFDDELRVGVAGDWCFGTRIEGAVLSGREVARRVAKKGSRTL